MPSRAFVAGISGAGGLGLVTCGAGGLESGGAGFAIGSIKVEYGPLANSVEVSVRALTDRIVSRGAADTVLPEHLDLTSKGTNLSHSPPLIGASYGLV